MKMLRNTTKVMKNFSNLIQKSGLCTRTNEETSESVIVEKIGSITTIGLNRPDKRNCLDKSTLNSLVEAIENFEKDSTSSVGVLHGLGGNFCAGTDLNEISKLDPASTHEFEYQGLPLRIIEKPLVAAVSGYAVGGGFELALMCDLRVVEENAVMGMFNRRFGVPCLDAGTIRLSAIIGLSRSLDITLTGRSMNAREAFNWGLANRLVKCGTALGQSLQVAGSLVKFPQKCLLHERKMLYKAAFGNSLEELFKFQRKEGMKILDGESVKGARKFIDFGIGKHGKTYDLKDRDLPRWEK